MVGGNAEGVLGVVMVEEDVVGVGLVVEGRVEVEVFVGTYMMGLGER